MELPQAFKEKMERLLGAEYTEFLESYEKERKQGLRLNLLKTSRKKFEQEAPFSLSPIPWTEEGYYYGKEDRPGLHPYHEAGVYYIQEPSAMAVVSLLDPKPGERILDLCAAPGGKSSHIASRLKGQGFLLSNEIHPARARILSQNMERMGVYNCVVSNQEPGQLAPHFTEYFHGIVVDAPCSGEGMFRKDSDIIKAGNKKMIDFCLSAQYEILEACARAVCVGGYIVYSTCTFNPDENERQIEAFLQRHPEFELCDIPEEFGLDHGRPEWTKSGDKKFEKCGRLWPHKISGEGHFVAKMVKTSGKERTDYNGHENNKIDGFEYFEQFLNDNISGIDFNGDFETFGEKLYMLPKNLPSFNGIRVVRNGWYLGDIKKKRFEPSQAFAMGLKKENVKLTEELKDYDTAVKYLKGETLETELEKDGWVLVNFDGLSLGWAKSQKGRLKNKYLPGWKWE